MISKIKLITFGIVLTVFCASINPSLSTVASGPYSDNFNSNSINPIWTKQTDSGVHVIQTNGVLTFTETSLGSTDSIASIYKSISPAINRIDVDYSFNFLNEMGKLYIIGKDSTGVKQRFGIGINDGWTGYNGKPIAYIYNADGTQPNASSSWHLQDLSSYMLQNSGGTGHIMIKFDSPTEITINFTFPVTNDGISSYNNTVILGGTTDLIYLVFAFPPSNYYNSNECFMFDNYAENGNIPSQQMSQTCSVTATTPMNPNNIYNNNNNVNYGNNVNSGQPLFNNLFSGNILAIVVIGGGIICVCLFIIYSDKNKINHRNNRQIEQNVIQNNEIKYNKLLCVNCNSKILPEDRFCQNCGTMIARIDDFK